MEAPEPHTFYRVVRSDPPTLRDFQSYTALGKPLLRSKPTLVELAAWAAVSTYVTEDAARNRAELNAARGLPIGHFIAKLVIAEASPIKIGRINEQTGHCGLTGEPSDLLAAVVSTVKA